MAPKFLLTENYRNALSEIEDFIYESSESVAVVEKLLISHDKALEFVGQNPNTPAIHPQAGDQSWIFEDGRYRIFFKVAADEKEVKIYLTHIIDNRRSNLDIYPNNSLPTYEIE